MPNILDTIYENIITGEEDAVEKDVNAALESGIAAEEILQSALIAAMDEVGELFASGEFFVPEMLCSARAMKAGLKILKPLFTGAGNKTAGIVAIGTVKGDMHDIGKNLVGMMLEGGGYEYIDLGIDVTPEKFIEAINNGANIIGMSALLTTTMPSMLTVIKAIEAVNLRDQVKVIIGGAPVSPEFADKIGADGYASDAAGAVKLVRELLA